MRKNSVVTVLISALLLLALISTPAHAIGATSTENCSISGTFTITSGVVSGGNSCAGVAVIPASVTSIGNSAFAGATALTSITVPASVTSIGITAFAGATALTSITIPASVTTIGPQAFQNTTALTFVTFDATSTLTTIGNYAFLNARALTSITIPASVTSIPEGAFYGATALTSITIPASVTSIGDLAFQDATSLASVYFLGNAPATIGITPFLNTAPGAKALIRSGTTGFTTSGTPALWNGLAVEVVADTPMPAQTPQLAETGASEPIALGVMASMSATLVASGMFLLHRRRKLG